jgi:hypothetical protein
VRKRWERNETRHGRSKHTPTFMVVSKPPKFTMMDASTWQLCVYGQKIAHLPTTILIFKNAL